MNTLYMTVGLPRSGKSSWARSIDCPIVNPDSIRLALYGQAYTPEAEPMVWAIARYMVTSLFLAGHTAVVLDATNGTRARRDEWISKSWSRVFRVFDTTPDQCIARCDDAHEYLVPVIERMHASWEGVSRDEGEIF